MRRMVWNGNELVFDDKPLCGVAGIAPGQPDSLGEEIALAYNAYFASSNNKYTEPKGSANPQS